MRKKKSGALLLSVLAISFAFAVMILCFTGSIERTNSGIRLSNYGAWYGAIPAGQVSDLEFLNSEESLTWMEQLGVSTNYGTVDAYGIGTADNTFVEIGNLAVLDGHFPEESGEIAMEADLLSLLGYDYTLGQTITLNIAFSAGEDTVLVEGTFTLCGILKEYTDLWYLSANAQGQLLNSALITQEDADALWDAANQLALDALGIAADETVPSWFFTVQEDMEQTMTDAVNAYLQSTRTLSTGDQQVCVNTLAYADSADPVYHTVYICITLLATLLAVLCIYAVYLPDQVRYVVRFRSIGGTKGQLMRLILLETLLICIPAVLLGIFMGILGLYGLLRLAVYAGSAEILLAVPRVPLVCAVLLWLAGILLIRLITFQIAMRTPLTGGRHMEISGTRRIQKVQNMLLPLICGLCCGGLSFMVLETVPQWDKFQNWSATPSYTIRRSSTETYDVTTGETILWPGVVTEDELTQIRNISGVSLAEGFAQLPITLTFDGMEDVALAKAMMGSSDDLDVTLYAIDPDSDGWENTFDLERTGVDLEAFADGDCIVLAFDGSDSRITYETLSYDIYAGDYVWDIQTFSDTGLSVGDRIQLSVQKTTEQNQTSGECDTIVGGFLNTSYDSICTRSLVLTEPYTVICSTTFLKRLVDSLEEGYVWDIQTGDTGYTSDGEAGYNRVFVYAQSDAAFLSTDSALAELCSENNLLLYNQRETVSAHTRQYLQSFLLLLVSGSAVVLILLLIMRNVMKLKARQERRKYGILQALGMSAGQVRLAIFKQAFREGVFAVCTGWIFYGCYLLGDAVRCVFYYYEELEQETTVLENFTEQIIGLNLKLVILLSLLELLLFLVVFWSSRRQLVREDIMDKLRDAE
ncbi:MAG: ABC transporter permease [Oscillospiraceae bacterium]|nr:ABC transporter permease [Oscillospiraceae bacterium]